MGIWRHLWRKHIVAQNVRKGWSIYSTYIRRPRKRSKTQLAKGNISLVHQPTLCGVNQALCVSLLDLRSRHGNRQNVGLWSCDDADELKYARRDEPDPLQTATCSGGRGGWCGRCWQRGGGGGGGGRVKTKTRKLV